MDAKARQDLLEWVAEISGVREGNWDSSLHPRVPKGQPDGGQWVATGGSAGANATKPSSFLDAIARRNATIASLTGVVTPGMIQPGSLAAKLQSAAQLAGEMARAAAAGLLTGVKAVVNGSATAIKSVATLGLDTSQLELIGVTKEDRANGYDTAVAISTASGQVLIAVGTGGVASALSKGGSIARTASGAILAFDSAGNAVGVVQGIYDATQNGVSISNGAQVAGGLLGLGANANAARGLKPTASAKEVVPGRGGRYGHLEDPPTVNSGKDFTPTQKKTVIAENKRQNGGELRDDRTGEVLVPPQQRQRGVPAPPDEAQVDHVYPKSQGGPNTYSNAEVRSRLDNIRKGKRID